MGNFKKRSNGNFTEGNVILENTKNSYLRSENRLIVGIDLNDLIVVETRDAILISDKKSSQKVKNIVNHLKKIKSQKVNLIQKFIDHGDIIFQ